MLLIKVSEVAATSGCTMAHLGAALGQGKLDGDFTTRTFFLNPHLVASLLVALLSNFEINSFKAKQTRKICNSQ